VNTVKDLLLATSINSETVIVTRGSDVLLSDDTVNDKDTITLLSVISGG
jgi:sulfur carrier protein ThiS